MSDALIDAHPANPSGCLLEVRDLRKAYENGSIEALRGVSLRVEAGEFLAITGASGSGKSTLLQLMGGLDSPSEGSVLFRGRHLGEARDSVACVNLDTYRARCVGFIFQAFHLLPSLDVLENVQVPMIGRAGDRHKHEQRARELLQEVGLEHRLRQYPGQLSAGERQRVAIARSLANSPEMLFADEPTGNLDSVNSAKIIEILIELQARRGMTLIMVTHDAGIAASAHNHIVLRDGRLCG
jgi:ABC-type lipoprotein export system ATPase subunit